MTQGTRRVCVFCGLRPREKTVEHVIPRWLVELTGPRNRQINFPLFRLKAKTPDYLTFRSLQFPACKECNQSFSTFESSAKRVVSKILNLDDVNDEDLTVLLDWLDKIRVGMWLGVQYLEKNMWDIEPQFYITDRIGTRDRVVFVYQFDDDWEGISFQGINTPSFHYWPSCFTLIINRFAFFNVSDLFLLSRRMGLPFPAKGKLPAGQLAEIDVQQGIERQIHPLLRIPHLPLCTELYQCVLSDKSLDGIENYLQTDYARGMMTDTDRRIGNLMINVGRQLKRYPQKPSDQWLPPQRQFRPSLSKKLALQTFRFQNDLWDLLYFSQDKALKKLIQQIKRTNDLFIGITSKADGIDLLPVRKRES